MPNWAKWRTWGAPAGTRWCSGRSAGRLGHLGHGQVFQWRHRLGRGTGASALAAGLEEALRAADAGIDGVLVSDIGLLWALGRSKRAGKLPADFVLKTSLALRQ